MPRSVPLENALALAAARLEGGVLERAHGTGVLVLARDAQDFLHGRLAAQNFPAAVVADRGRQRACVALEVVFGGTVMNHGAHLVIHHDKFVDAGASAIAIARIAARPEQ